MGEVLLFVSLVMAIAMYYAGYKALCSVLPHSPAWPWLEMVNPNPEVWAHIFESIVFVLFVFLVFMG